MKRVTEFNLSEKELKKYLEECLKEQNINYEIKIEERWIQKYKEASEFYQVYCLYVSNEDLEKVEQIINDYKNAIVITDDIEELKNIDTEEEDNRYKFFNHKNFLKYYWLAIIIVGLLIIIGVNMTK